MFSRMTMLTVAFGCHFLWLAPYVVGQTPKLPNDEKACIQNAYQLWRQNGDKIWPGWTDIQMPMVYITENHEFAIGFASAPDGFEEYPWKHDGIPTYIRPRQFPQGLAASFPFQGIPAVIMGSYKTHKTNPTRWSLTAIHEMFHVLQMQRGSMEKVKSLKIVEGENDGSWQLNYPFPYDDSNVMRSFHLFGYPLFLAATQTDLDTEESKSSVRYNIGTAIDSTKVLQAFLKLKTGNDRAFRYAQFQQWKEGIARYTEYRMAEMAAFDEYTPPESLRKLDGFESYQQAWRNHYQTQLFLAKHAGRVSRTRIEFYNLGLAVGVALDNSGVEWKDAYFAPDIWLEDLLAQAAGSVTTRIALAIGSNAPEFELTSVQGGKFRLSDASTKFVLIDFWQPWCPPCIDSFDQLKSLQEKHVQELSIVGVVDRNRTPKQLKQLCEQENIEWPTLLDESGKVAREFGVEGYPHLFLINVDGKVVWEHRGALSKETVEALKKLISQE